LVDRHNHCIYDSGNDHEKDFCVEIWGVIVKCSIILLRRINI
jgi:hypothetical protein